jgi:hypothetical protein
MLHEHPGADVTKEKIQVISCRCVNTIFAMDHFACRMTAGFRMIQCVSSRCAKRIVTMAELLISNDDER